MASRRMLGQRGGPSAWWGLRRGGAFGVVGPSAWWAFGVVGQAFSLRGAFSPAPVVLMEGTV